MFGSRFWSDRSIIDENAIRDVALIASRALRAQ
jgi:hypothetical protein